MTSRSDFPSALRNVLSPPRERSDARVSAAFVDAARGKPSISHDLTDGLESLAVVSTAEQAARIGQRVAVTNAVEES